MQLHWFYIVGLLVIVLIIFGPGRLPELGGALGKAMREFRKATTDITNEMTSAVNSAAPAPVAATPPPVAAPPPPLQPVQPASSESPGSTGSQSEATSPKV
ncbi:MAG TPA: twin-arginine translocase TatA/TatE family subunit [Candidatus Acidoferrum sp.]|jgi:sec-independent protein translocase protein TatA|nr:twin-arginine translocase TatA/TatE family subunit [Candidatus Acidoferrum sp.]